MGLAEGLAARMAPHLYIQEPLSAQQLKKLEEHKYSASGRSLVEPPMQVYWNWLVEKVPLWLAPNTITMVGLLLNVLSTLILVCYCPTATEGAPFWTYLLCAIGLFVYQSLDAIDGKQARRTNSSSPLGEMFDHGCDSISIVFVNLGTIAAVRLGTLPGWMFYCCFVGMFMFYCAQWQTYVCGTLKFGIIDVTELQISVTVMFLMTAVCGPELWDYEIPFTGLPMKTIPLLGIIGGTVYSCSNYFRVILSGGVGKNGSTVAGTSVLSPGLHIGLVLLLALMIYKKSTTNLFLQNPCLYTLAFGFVSAKITIKLVIAHMTKSEISLQDTAFIGPGLLFFNQYFNSFIDEYIVLWIAMVISFADLLRYCISVCLQIATHLRISVFRISSNQAAEQVQTQKQKLTD
ncbi:cholinephosphotransferase 1 [Xenopus laevis]|uniref:Cholinephosphotransferase 1 n=1 Tax=Xenopus laevis TaxID=8355 RepID=CHPT1_XENLA|nr:cholinephosphotransferase 1 [Xenopus laevis]Q4KLV1.1 RecName: Full=Cholinephosphotransferase 1; AltName: Full=Diacylglycerol cholinephosphotransferase 1; AltName: Full=xlCHPT1 [Xenopus laevis]8ERO_A Chain A, Cholinephosphotransferase 1 [Xenopus laevis]8ERO_B Chain B, Cholinephosphotransferase 1 [Xenopus laevis]8ERP_A Chain A, Cholinephosphotransferase 1 [Xenopus laevis]8ERP_B Chain B, Cholinephosphotransferase 1 [Xenopus laevis]AAH98988.1 MGC114982 protein [Xenopus laevis]